jgi:hypothetical protein
MHFDCLVQVIILRCSNSKQIDTRLFCIHPDVVNMFCPGAAVVVEGREGMTPVAMASSVTILQAYDAD